MNNFWIKLENSYLLIHNIGRQSLINTDRIIQTDAWNVQITDVELWFCYFNNTFPLQIDAMSDFISENQF